MHMFLPFVHAVLTFAVSMPDADMRDWYVNVRFTEVYGPIWKDLLIGIAHDTLSLYEEFSMALEESTDYLGLAAQY